MGARSSWHLIFGSSDRGLIPQSSPTSLTAVGRLLTDNRVTQAAAGNATVGV